MERSERVLLLLLLLPVEVEEVEAVLLVEEGGVSMRAKYTPLSRIIPLMIITHRIEDDDDDEEDRFDLGGIRPGNSSPQAFSCPYFLKFSIFLS